MSDLTAFKRLSNAQGILFDLDNTLYPREKGVFDRINERINDFVRQFTDCREDRVDALRRAYKDRYGTTLGGLIEHHSIDPEVYLDFVHDVPVEEMLGPDDALISFLGSIDLPMVIFTNGTCSHAARVLDAMQIAGYFSGICDLTATAYLGKPNKEAYDTAAGFLGCSLDRTIFIDDLQVNVEAGKAFGAMSIHVNGQGHGAGDMQVRCVKELEPVFSRMPWFREKP